MAESEFVVEPLVKAHGRAVFSCGNQSLDRYIREQARKEQERRVARVYVLRHIPTDRIAGYHTLSASAVETRSLPDDIANRLPRYEVQPVILLGRLARDVHFRGQGIGGLLLRDALERGLEAQQRIGAIAVVVDAIDDPAASFYEAYGFIRLPGGANQLFIAMETIAQAAAQASSPQ
ncbi:MAG TPA: GNAT family N-acetyltransferase [Chloroflexota bacterium]|nr:GNAT family N-acetyltransferase [Chloroflexota bacterium]